MALPVTCWAARLPLAERYRTGDKEPDGGAGVLDGGAAVGEAGGDTDGGDGPWAKQVETLWETPAA